MKFTTHFDLHSQASRLSSNNSPRAYTESNMLLYHTATMPRAVKGRAPTRSGLPGVLLVCTRVTHIHIFTCISTRIDASISGGGECLIGGFRADDFVGRSPQKTGAHATRQGAGSTRAAPGSQEFRARVDVTEG